MQIIARIKRYFEFKDKGIKVWYPCNIYGSAKIATNVSIGMYSEIGPHVMIGNDTKIGSGVFIPHGVFIGCGCFIGPHVCFSNDMYPPSSKDDWQSTTVCTGASIGANVSIRPGVVIGKNALVGMGSVVTENIPDNEIWAGVPAKKIRRK